MRDCAQLWHGQLGNLLDGESTPARMRLDSDGGVNLVEMCVAQLETTLSNIDSLDWQGETAEILKCMDREINSLDNVIASLRLVNLDLGNPGDGAQGPVDRSVASAFPSAQLDAET